MHNTLLFSWQFLGSSKKNKSLSYQLIKWFSLLFSFSVQVCKGRSKLHPRSHIDAKEPMNAIKLCNSSYMLFNRDLKKFLIQLVITSRIIWDPRHPPQFWKNTYALHHAIFKNIEFWSKVYFSFSYRRT